MPELPRSRFSDEKKLTVKNGQEVQMSDQDIFDAATPNQRFAMLMMYGQHTGAEAECYAFAQQIADSCSCRLIKGPMKTLVRANEKVERDYTGVDKDTGKVKGEWQDVKDLVRVTILAPALPQLANVRKQIEMMGSKPPWSIVKNKLISPPGDSCGYTGLNAVVEKKRGAPVGARSGQPIAPRPTVSSPFGPQPSQIRDMRWALTVRMEIQANIPCIIYGKQHEKDFKDMLGDIGPTKFKEMQNMYNIVGGLGHDFYELSQKPPSDDIKKAVMALSKRYYEYLRNRFLPREDFVRLCRDIGDFIERPEVKPFFAKHPILSVSHTPLPARPDAPKKLAASWPPPRNP
jgi:hypothetical protein